MNKTYSHEEVEEIKKTLEEDRIAWLKDKEAEITRLRKELSDKSKWCEEYIASISKMAFEKHCKTEKILGKEIEELKLQLKASDPTLIEKDRISWYSRLYPELSEELNSEKSVYVLLAEKNNELLSYKKKFEELKINK